MVDDPADAVVTVPVLLMVATADVPEVHMPPGVGSLRVVLVPRHRSSVPAMGAGTGFTVT